jgi:hypothetical protein
MKTTHVVDCLCDIKDIEITISAAVELDDQSNSKERICWTYTKTPIRYFGWYTPNLSSLPSDIGRSRSIQEEQINYTAKNVVFNILSSFGEFDVHPVRVQEEDTAGRSVLSSLLVYKDRVGSIKICS